MYIVFEGIIGSGKSTQSKKLVEWFREVYGSDQVIHIREPGSTPIAEDIRELAQGRIWADEEMHPLTNAYLYAAARAQTLHTVVQPAIASGRTVISDRCFLSSCAFQGEAQGLGIDTVLSVNHDAIEGMLPDIVFYMDIDVETAMARTFDVMGDKWERMGTDFFRSVVCGYEKCEKWKPLRDRFIRIDASGTPDEVFARIKMQLKGVERK